ncbi:Penicillin amidase family protein [Candidatus Phaeomarinobacter ectocarpi]|uniref:Penicillin amidase family protein n=1 Tax=Candidatus Phaeomarinibacter ectocarpi TaxID=1458461 RepID=X5MNK9_9HYPH|nr:penicillin acylase family protein [Candidatus Phaeomarinobacter ectocarpi]CDO61370.1 Penicillin amidase family protein [Candidatus Phaeomarinobacter ectocarpi]
MTMTIKILRWTAITLATLAVVIGLLVLQLLGLAERAVPDYAGTMDLPGLSAPVEVIRDAHAVPHIFAESDPDAAFALGVSHAQDRLWQMELFRRVVQGRLSEVFGSAALPADRIIRTLDFYGHSKRSLAVLSPELRAALDAYAAGVNAYMSESTRPYPPEFQVLMHTPEPWQPADSVGMVKLLAAGLSGNAFSEVLRTRLMDVLDEEDLKTFDPAYPVDSKPAVRDLASLYRTLGLERIIAAIPDTGPPGASNNWVVDGKWTKSQKPLLANDPHLGMLAPSIWYAAHLNVGDSNVIGVTIPGIPSVVLGRNNHIGWGFTNTGPDTQDMAIEEVNPENPDQYRTPDGWADFVTREEEIVVRLGSDETLVVRETRNGPVLDAIAETFEDVVADGQVVALKWTALTSEDTTIEAGFRYTKARTVAEFDEATRLQVSPMQSMVVADVDGNIGMIAPAAVPVRSDAHETGGLLPASGANPANDWLGMIPHEGLPRVINPSHGYIATANNKIIADDFPYYISSSWDGPYRANRIEDMIEATRLHDVASFEAMLADNKSELAELLVPYFTSVEPETDQMAAAQSLLRDWDATMEKELAQPLIFHAALKQLHTKLYADELGDLADSVTRRRETFLLNALSGDEAAARWCDDTSTAETEHCTDVVRTSLAAGLEVLNDLYGSDMSTWTWGVAHPVVNNHLPMGFIPGVRNIFNIERPSAGGPYTVNRGQTGSGARPFANVHAAGYRAVFDFDDMNNSVYIISTGQSGNPASDYYDTFATLWADGGHIRMTTDRAEIEAGSIGTMTLRPAHN